MNGATLYDFRDVDVLLKLDAEGDSDGWVETEHLARALGLGDRANPNVGVRLAWMRRFGMLERDEKSGLWRLTSGAHRVIEAKLRAASKRELETLPDEAMVEVMANVAHRYRFTDSMTATLLRREFLFGTAPR
jgi:DNA-binding IclR family transcriptional regulator